MLQIWTCKWNFKTYQIVLIRQGTVVFLSVRNKLLIKQICFD